MKVEFDHVLEHESENGDIITQPVSVTCEVYISSPYNYGADADGRRGERRVDVEPDEATLVVLDEEGNEVNLTDDQVNDILERAAEKAWESQ